jgi:hypothetical protein
LAAQACSSFVHFVAAKGSCLKSSFLLWIHLHPPCRQQQGCFLLAATTHVTSHPGCPGSESGCPVIEMFFKSCPDPRLSSFHCLSMLKPPMPACQIQSSSLVHRKVMNRDSHEDTLPPLTRFLGRLKVEIGGMMNERFQTIKASPDLHACSICNKSVG